MKFPLKWVWRTSRNKMLLTTELSSRNSARFVFMSRTGDDYTNPNSNSVSESFITDKLNEISVPFKDKYTCFYIEGCGLCSKENKKLKEEKMGMYINKKTGFFLCNKCKAMGNWSTFFNYTTKLKNENSKVKQLLSEQNVGTYDKAKSEWKNVIGKTLSIYELSAEKYNSVFENFKLRQITKEKAKLLNIRISTDMMTLYVPLSSFNFSIVGYKAISMTDEIITFPNSDCPGVLTSQGCHTTAVVVAEVSDFFALESENLSMDVVCLPHGISCLPQSSLPFLEKYDELILWLGGASTLDATTNFAKKLNEKRCRIVKPIETQTSALAAVTKNKNIMEILEKAKSAWHECIISFQSLRDEILTDLQNKDLSAGIQWKRFPVLNNILKGHRRGELTILTGPTGSGKTTFISEYSLDLAMQGVNTLWGSFEIKNSRLAKKMLQQFSQVPLEENLNMFNYWANKFEQLPIFFMTFHGQQPLSTVMDTVEHSSYVHDIAHVIIDNVQFMIDVFPSNSGMDRFWKQDILIQSFRSFASNNNCHVTLVMHPKKGMDGLDLSINSIFGGAKAAQEADNIFIIQNQIPNSFTSKKYLQISKNRYSGDLGAMALNFNKSSHCFSTNNNQETQSAFDVYTEHMETYGGNKQDDVCYYNENELKKRDWNRIMQI